MEGIMALTLGVKIGDVVDVADHWVAVLSIDGRNSATLISSDGQKILAAAPDAAPAALFARARWLLESLARREPEGAGGPASVAAP
jgi:hypothetical protein